MASATARRSCTRAPGTPDCESTPPSHQRRLHPSNAATNPEDEVSGNHSPHIDSLYDSRVLHVIRRPVQRLRDRLRLLRATGAAARIERGEPDERSTHRTLCEDTGPLLRRRLELRSSLHGPEATRRRDPMRAQSHVAPHGGPIKMRVPGRDDDPSLARDGKRSTRAPSGA
jgi:hypothetical protein